MNERFSNMMITLSDKERFTFARALLMELEGTVPVVRRFDEVAVNQAGAEKLAGVVERLSAVVKSHTSAAAQNNVGVSQAERDAAYFTLRSQPDGGTSDDADEQGHSAFVSPAAGTECLDMEKLSELVRRDSRRYDDGFRRY